MTSNSERLISPIYRYASEIVDEHTRKLGRINADHIKRARIIARSLGIATAARYLKRRGWSLEATKYVLLGK